MPPPKVALVTGSGRRRVGRAVVERFARDGFAVALHYRSAAAEAAAAVAELCAAGADADAFPADLADEAAVRGLVGAVAARWGRLDVLVTCASVWQKRRLEDVTAADLRAHYEANVLATFLPAREAGLLMAARPDGGCIVTVGDWAEARPYTDYAAYFATKGALPTLTRCLAVELGTRNPRVRVNCVLPGPVLLPPDLPAAERAVAIRSTLVGREGSPENVADAVYALAANDFITGACLPVDGGRTVYAGGA